LDTHVLVWWVSGLRPLSPRARRSVSEALKSGPLLASAISIFEIVTAARRGRLVLGAPVSAWLHDLGRLPDLRIEPVTLEVAQLAGALDDSLPGDPADRIIVATARATGAKIVTADERLRRAEGVDTIW
jgi:PIN domain nuclease of toxin-antitoxin system